MCLVTPRLGAALAPLITPSLPRLCSGEHLPTVGLVPVATRPEHQVPPLAVRPSSVSACRRSGPSGTRELHGERRASPGSVTTILVWSDVLLECQVQRHLERQQEDGLLLLPQGASTRLSSHGGRVREALSIWVSSLPGTSGRSQAPSAAVASSSCSAFFPSSLLSAPCSRHSVGGEGRTRRGGEMHQ